MTATTNYPYTEREIERTADELDRMLTFALWALDRREPAPDTLLQDWSGS